MGRRSKDEMLEAATMPIDSPVLTSVAVCLVAAAFEGLCAGTGVKAFFATLRFPRFAAPLWLWSIIGAMYYLIFGMVLFRLLLLGSRPPVWWTTITLLLGMMLANGLTNVVMFRFRNLHLSYIIGAVFPVLDVALFVLVLALDRVAAAWLGPYLLYRVYAVWWGYGVWKLNSEVH
jgi:translocator protein